MGFKIFTRTVPSYDRPDQQKHILAEMKSEVSAFLHNPEELSEADYDRLIMEFHQSSGKSFTQMTIVLKW